MVQFWVTTPLHSWKFSTYNIFLLYSTTHSQCQIFDLVGTNNCHPFKIFSFFMSPLPLPRILILKVLQPHPDLPFTDSHASLVFHPLSFSLSSLPSVDPQILNAVITSQPLPCILGPSSSNIFYPWLGPTLPSPHLHSTAEYIWGKTQSYWLVSLLVGSQQSVHISHFWEHNFTRWWALF